MISLREILGSNLVRETEQGLILLYRLKNMKKRIHRTFFLELIVSNDGTNSM
jgi:hypothetical protein